MRKIVIGGIFAVLIVLVVFVSMFILSSSPPNETKTNQQTSSNTRFELNKTLDNYTGRVARVTFDIEGKPQTISLPIDKALFQIDYTLNAQGNPTDVYIDLKPELTDFYKQVGFFDKPANAVVVYPLFTQAAYGIGGFYDYYLKKCDSKCLTVNIHNDISMTYPTAGRAFAILRLLHYDYVTDVDVDKNPDILKKYDKIIVLHNEYVTQKEFDAITSHPNVIYLYPNALYAKITTNYTNNSITLIQGHGYPDPSMLNGFDWKFDNSKYEYDITCDSWQFYKIDNGQMLNCYPSFRLYFDKSLLQALAS